MRSRQHLCGVMLAVLAGTLAPLAAVAGQAPAPTPSASVSEPAPAVASSPLASRAEAAPSAPAAPAPVAAAAATTAAADNAGRPAVVLPASPMAGPSAGNLLQTIFALTLVLGVLFALAWFMKRYGPKAGTGSANLNVVGALNLGGRERILVVEVGDQWIVVGASPGRINALATMPKQEGLPAQAVLAGHAPPASNFAQWLKQTIDKRNAN